MKGLERYSSAPVLTASTAPPIEGYPVIIMTSVSGVVFANIFHQFQTAQLGHFAVRDYQFHWSLLQNPYGLGDRGGSVDQVPLTWRFRWITSNVSGASSTTRIRALFGLAVGITIGLILSVRFGVAGYSKSRALPGALSTRTEPPWEVTMPWTTARPRPVP